MVDFSLDNYGEGDGEVIRTVCWACFRLLGGIESRYTSRRMSGKGFVGSWVGASSWVGG